MPHLRLAILGESPCSACTSAMCCRQNGHEFAVLLLESEHRRFAPFAVDIALKQGAHNIVEKVLPYVDGKCQFLGEDNRCTIYEDRPTHCRSFQCIDHYHTRGSTIGTHGPFLARNRDVLTMLESL